MSPCSYPFPFTSQNRHPVSTTLHSPTESMRSSYLLKDSDGILCWPGGLNRRDALAERHLYGAQFDAQVEGRRDHDIQVDAKAELHLLLAHEPHAVAGSGRKLCSARRCVTRLQRQSQLTSQILTISLLAKLIAYSKTNFPSHLRWPAAGAGLAQEPAPPQSCLQWQAICALPENGKPLPLLHPGSGPAPRLYMHGNLRESITIRCRRMQDTNPIWTALPPAGSPIQMCANKELPGRKANSSSMRTW